MCLDNTKELDLGRTCHAMMREMQQAHSYAGKNGVDYAALSKHPNVAQRKMECQWSLS